MVIRNAISLVIGPEGQSFVNTDGSTATVVMNKTDKPVRFELKIGAQVAAMDAPDHSIQTVVVGP